MTAARSLPGLAFSEHSEAPISWLPGPNTQASTLHAMLAMKRDRSDDWIDQGLRLVGIISLFGGLAALVMLGLTTRPGVTIDELAVSIARADDSMLRTGREPSL